MESLRSASIDLDPAAKLLSLLRSSSFLGKPTVPSDPTPGVTVVVPVFDAFDETVACVESVALRTDRPFRLLLLNDGSRDPRVSALLSGLNSASVEGLSVVNRLENLGFVATANEGMRLADPSDVVLLNSDTVVTSGWLTRLAVAAYRHPCVATVTPLTNRGTICSVPTFLEENDLPDGFDPESFARLIASLSSRLHPEVPTGVGFCLYIRREALRHVGLFDAVTFGRGYGEENDFCQRAIQAGFTNRIADDAFVFHRGHASFGGEHAVRMEANLRKVARRHPRYLSDVAKHIAAHPLRQMHDRLAAAIRSGREARHPVDLRVAHVLHAWGGGTDKHVRDLVAEARDEGLLQFVVRSDGEWLRVEEWHDGVLQRRLAFPLRVALSAPFAWKSEAYAEALGAVCDVLAVDRIHFHQSIHNPPDAAEVLAARGVSYCVTVHDHYPVCPTVTLLGPDEKPCGACLEGPEGPRQRVCMRGAGMDTAYLAAHQAQMRRWLVGADRIYVPAQFGRDTLLTVYPEVSAKIVVRAHGLAGLVDAHSERAGGSVDGVARAFASEGRAGTCSHFPRGSRPPAPGAGPPWKVAVVGAISRDKGVGVLRGLLRLNRRDDLVFHLYGYTDDPGLQSLAIGQEHQVAGSRFVPHGPYDANEITGRLVADGVHLALHLSLWPETFSYTLSEMAAAGVPVIAGNLGAVGERIRRHGLGWLVDDIQDETAVLSLLEQVVSRPADLADARARMDREGGSPPLESVAAEYVADYRRATGGQSQPLSRQENLMDDRDRYTEFLAMQLARLENRPETGAAGGAVVHHCNSPRYRIVDALCAAAQRVPLLWGILTGTYERWARRQRARQAL